MARYAIISAFEDTRFDSISKNELKSLKVSLSCLINFEEGKDYLDWEFNKHGV